MATNDRPATGAFNRRNFLIGSGITAAVMIGTGVTPAHADQPKVRSSKIKSYPFTLGVASGDPLPNSIVLWTRLAPEPYAADGLSGMPQTDFTVHYQVAEDEQFSRIVKRGSAIATPALNHSVHPEVWGLEPNRYYYYRFLCGSDISPVGRTKTAPPAGAALNSVQFAFASCSWWDGGFFNSYKHMADEDLDLVIHLGDYVYEDAFGATAGARNVPVPSQLRPLATDLLTYRLHYSLYKSDPDLQAAHAVAPWVVTPDDHEVADNWGGVNPSHYNAAALLTRRTAAFQAYYENLPFRAAQIPQGPDMQLYRKLSYGNLVDFNILDTRQYRDPQALTDGWQRPNPIASDPSRTITGDAQEKWLLDNFANSDARWQVLGNQVVMTNLDDDPGPGELLYMDEWPGYLGSRDRVLRGAVDRGVDNLIVITGDWHENIVSDLLLDYSNPSSQVVGTEFVGTSISSLSRSGEGADISSLGNTLLATSPWLKFYNSRNGYVRCTITPDQWTSDFRVVPYVSRQGAPISTRATYVVENGAPGAQLA